MEDEVKKTRKEIKIRKKFPGDMDPSTKIHKVKSDYSRSQNRDEIQKALDEALEEMEQDEMSKYE